ncbi:unnamed protein product [Durusdinium trenchii]|uniref:Transmembrane protein n=1 Tax=Durusdinium trenchii TaxID=1381693 RepID=A0ABP0IZL7_9DINO
MTRGVPSPGSSFTAPMAAAGLFWGAMLGGDSAESSVCSTGAEPGFGVPPPKTFEPPPGSKVVPRKIFSPARLELSDKRTEEGRRPIHHYLARSRKPFWCDAEELATPPRIYVDQKSVFREIASVTQLRRGDHCMITLNVLRCLSPNIDYFVSLMGSLELFHLYHHFVILDDVSHVDEFGVPRTKQDKIVHIMEYSNTVEGFVEELRVKSFGAWHSFPKILFDCTLKKARCDRVPLADYGDMPHIFRMEERLTEQQRERIVHDAEKLIENPRAYNVLCANCEHTTNLVSGKQQFTSPEVHFFIWSICRYLLTIIGLATLHVVTMQCYSRYCLQYPLWALAAYYLCTALPVLAQIIVQYGRLANTVYHGWRKSLISRNDVYHLLVKELCRAIFNGALAFGFLLWAPDMLQFANQRYPVRISIAIVFAYFASDALFALLAQVVTRILLHKFGRFWLIGGSDHTWEEEQRLADATPKEKDE